MEISAQAPLTAAVAPVAQKNSESDETGFESKLAASVEAVDSSQDEEGKAEESNTVAVGADALAWSPQALSMVLAAEAGEEGSAPNIQQLKESRLAYAGAKAAEDLTGPSPWNSEWVFDGITNNTRIQPLVGQSVEQQKAALLKQILSGSPEAGSLTQTAITASPEEALAAIAGQKSAPGAAALNPAAASLSGGQDLQVQLQQLNGSMEGLKVQMPGAAAVQSAKPQSATYQGLSGDDFVQTLNGVKSSPSQSLTALPVMNNGTAGSTMAFTQGDAQAGVGDQWQQSSQGSPLQLRPELALRGGEVGELQSHVMQETQKTNNVYEPDFTAHAALQSAAKMPVLTVEGEVVKGALTMDRLSHASLDNLSSSVQQLKQQGGGEIRLHLNPEHLGSLKLRVHTVGNQVALQIEASDLAARQVLEDSMIYLRDKLTTQNLSLGRVEVSLSSTANHNSALGLNNNDGLMADQGQYQNLNHQQRNDAYFGNSGDENVPAWMDDRRLVGNGKMLSPQGLAAARSDLSRNGGRTDGRIDIRA